MPLEIVRGDITKQKVDAIVNAANKSLLGGRGVDGAIHAAAGDELLLECITLGGCETGEAKITKGYKLPAKYVIHTVGPVWNGGGYNEEDLLESSFLNSLALAKENNIESIAFPLISTGAYNFPKTLAYKIAIKAFKQFLEFNEMHILLVLYDEEKTKLNERETVAANKFYINKNPKLSIQPSKKKVAKKEVEPLFQNDIRLKDKELCCACLYVDRADLPEKLLEELKKIEKYEKITTLRKVEFEEKSCLTPSLAAPSPLDFSKKLKETFSERLNRYIEENKLKPSFVYKKANIDKQLFSKIKNDIYYQPKKATVIAFAIALELNADETLDLLKSAGYTLSESLMFDMVILYFIKRKRYDIFDINATLFDLELELLGSFPHS